VNKNLHNNDPAPASPPKEEDPKKGGRNTRKIYKYMKTQNKSKSKSRSRSKK
jgi:hypothetical protein